MPFLVSFFKSPIILRAFALSRPLVGSSISIRQGLVINSTPIAILFLSQVYWPGYKLNLGGFYRCRWYIIIRWKARAVGYLFKIRHVPFSRIVSFQHLFVFFVSLLIIVLKKKSFHLWALRSNLLPVERKNICLLVLL